MRTDLLLAKPNIGRRARLALRAAAGGAGLYGAVVALLFWNLNATLNREQTTLKTTRKQASEGRAARRRKREEAARIGIVHAAPPAGSGTAEFTEELCHLASASGSEMFSVQFPTSGAVTAPPPPPPSGDPANGANGGGNSPNGNGSSGSSGSSGSNGSNGSVAPAADANPDDGWKRAPFECNLTGSFPALQDFLERLTRLPRVVEISGIELHRDRVDTRTGTMRVHLKLTGAVFGQDARP